MNSNQKLRYLINRYWEVLNIDNLYENYKLRVFKVKKGSEIPEETKLLHIEQFKYGLQALAEWMDDIKEVRENILKKLG